MSLQSSSSSTALSSTSTGSSFLSSSNSENLNPTANWNLNGSLNAVPSSRSPVKSEEIIASVGSSPSPMIRPPPPQLPLPMTNRDDEVVLDPEDIMVNEAILLSIQDGKERVLKRQELSFSSGNMEPVGVENSSVAVTSKFPVKSEEIIASVGSSPSPKSRPPPPQLPLPGTNWNTMSEIVINLHYGGTLKNSNANKGLPFEGPGVKCCYTQIDRRLKTLDELKMIVMEELSAKLAVHNMQITYRMPHEVFKNQINYKYMAIETDKHVKIMFDKLERTPEVRGIELYILLGPCADETIAINGEDYFRDFERDIDDDETWDSSES